MHFIPTAPSLLSRSLSNASVRTTQTQDSASSLKSSSSSASFWSAVLRPAKKNPPSISLPSPSPLRTIPSQTQLVFSPTDLTNPRPAPKITPRHARSASISSTVDSVSLSYSPSSSRSESPITPVSISSPFPYNPKATRRRSYDLPQSNRRHRRYLHMTTPLTPTKPNPIMTEIATPPFLSPPPPISRSPTGTKSILARTSSVSTRASSHTNRTNSNKSVKFATLPTTVYYSNPYRGPGGHGGNYWDLDPDNKSVDINIDSMDLDQDPFANYRSRVGDDDEDDEDDSEVEEKKKKKNEKTSMISKLRSITPTPEREREKQKAKRVKRLLTFARRSSTSVVPTAGSTTAIHRYHYHHRADSSAPSGTGARPAISSPYALGSHPHHHLPHPYHTLDTDTSYLNAPERPWTKSLQGQSGGGGAGHHSASCESLQSSKTTGAFSVRSVDSFGSLSLQVGVGVGRFRDWLGRTVANGKGG